jgi:hypothetical protein
MQTSYIVELLASEDMVQSVRGMHSLPRIAALIISAANDDF